jgi:hypothetical protein
VLKKNGGNNTIRFIPKKESNLRNPRKPIFLPHKKSKFINNINDLVSWGDYIHGFSNEQTNATNKEIHMNEKNEQK